MRDTNFLTENNARHMWHPMAHPAEMRAHPPRIIAAAQGVEITDIHGKTALDGVGGLWNVNLGYSSAPVKQAIADQLEALPYYSVFRGTANAPQIELSYELAEWFREGWCKRSIFNLKLPMKKRWDETRDCLQHFVDKAGRPLTIRAKQLYHDREEITVYAG